MRTDTVATMQDRPEFDVPAFDAPVFDVIVIGSLNLDLVASAPRLPGPGETVTGSTFAEMPGGKGLNQAVAAARAGASVALIGAVGNDDAGTLLRHVVLDEGIDDRWITVLAGVPTGRALITVDERAENVIVVIPGANAWDAGASETLPTARVVLAQLEVPLPRVERAFAAGKAIGAITILNPAPAAALPTALLGDCDLIIPNEHEAALLGGTDVLTNSGNTTVVVTRGGAGTTIIDGTGTRHLHAFAVHPVDTTGAGDAFCGALAARLAAGDDLATGVGFAMAAGALATTVAGAVPSLPHRVAIEQLLSEQE